MFFEKEFYFPKVFAESILNTWFNLFLMKKKSFYVDTCIYLNLWNKEGDESKGVPYWKIAKDFFEKIRYSSKIIYYSNIILKELKFNLESNFFGEKNELFKKDKKFVFKGVINEDCVLARKIQSKYNYEIGFGDCLHIAICKRLTLILITRDKKLIEIAKQIINVSKPEDLIKNDL